MFSQFTFTITAGNDTVIAGRIMHCPWDFIVGQLFFLCGCEVLRKNQDVINKKSVRNCIPVVKKLLPKTRVRLSLFI